MDETIAQPTQNSTNPRSVLIQIFPLLIIVVLFFLALNYFNLLSLSKANPKLFGRLPHKPYIINTGYRLPQPTQSLSPQDVSKILTTSLVKILDPSMLPASTFYLKQDNVMKEAFQASWSAQQKQFSANITASSKNKNITNSYLSFLDNTDASLSAATAKDIVSPYFILSPKGSWKCTNIYDSVYCENFWQENDGSKRGIGAQSIDTKQKVIFFCEHRQESTLYSWKSCANTFAIIGL